MPTLVDITPLAVAPPHMGGQRVIHDVNAALAALGWSVEQFSLGIRREDLRRPFRSWRMEVAPGYFEWRRTEPLSVLTFVASVALGLPNVWSDLALERRPWRELEETSARSAVVLVETPWAFHPDHPRRPPGIPLVYMSQNVESELAITVDSGTVTRRGAWLARHARRREEAILRAADLTLCITPEDRTALCETYGTDPGRLAVVPRGIDLRRFPVGDHESRRVARRALGYEDAPVALFVGSRHGPNVAAARFLIRLAAQLHPAVRCVVAGSVSTLIDEREAGPLWLRPGEPGAHLAAADIALNPMASGSGMNIKMLEYFAAGLPSITTPMGARGIAGTSGQDFVVAELDGFAEAVASLAADPARRERIGSSGRRLVETTYSAEASARALIAQLEELVAAR